MNRKILWVVFISLFAAAIVFPQDKDTVIVKNDDGTVDTVVFRSNNSREWDEWKDFDLHFDWFRDFHGKPSIAVNYGFAKTKVKDFKAEFADPNLLEMKIGYASERPAAACENIIKYKFRYLNVSNISTDLSNVSSSDPGLRTNLWRFGFGWSEAYGYKFGPSAIIPYYTYGIQWSRLEMKNMPASSAEKEKLLLYDKTFRFGTSMEGGVKFQIVPQLVLEGGYERAIIFERHLFWKWLGSAVIEAAGQSALDSFLEEVMDSSPYAAPIVSFVLKNALSYGLYELRQEKMNWPFDSARPLAYDQIKVGVSFIF